MLVGIIMPQLRL